MDPISKDASQLARLQAALDHINQGFTVFDAELRLVAWNEHLFDLLELPRFLAAKGTHLSEFFRVVAERGEYGEGEIEEMVQSRVERALRFEPHRFERPRPNGRVIAVRGMPLPQGGFVSTYTDITEERRRQELLEQKVAERTAALRQSEERLRLITDAIPAHIAYVDTTPRFTFANKRYAAWFGFSVEEIVGKTAEEAVGAALFGELKSHIHNALAGAETTYEYMREAADGRTHYMRTSLIPDFDEAGAVVGCFVLSLDVTEQKHGEAALLQSQRMEAIGQLTGGLAHDFNNLLTIIIGNLVRLKGKQGAPGETQTHLDPALHAAERGADLTSRLLAFARGQALDPRPVDVGELVRNVTELLKGSLPKSLELQLDVPEAQLTALADPTQLENALVNLALNARDAMPLGGKLTFRTSMVTLPKSAATEFDIAPGEYARISVADTGKGMEEHVRLHAFEPFFTTKPFGSGSGLGLSMVYGFVRQSGGAAAIDDSSADGTIVSIYLPLAAAEKPAGTATPAWRDLGDHDTLTDGDLVLLVEDDREVAQVVRGQLEDLGYAVLVAADPHDALTLMRSVPDIQILLSDIVMPGQMNGIALAKKAKTSIPRLKVALISGYTDGLEASDLAGCAFPILSKPFSRTALAKLLQRAA